MWKTINDNVRKLRESITWDFGKNLDGIEREKLRSFLKKVMELEAEALAEAVWEDVRWCEEDRKNAEDTPF